MGNFFSSSDSIEDNQLVRIFDREIKEGLQKSSKEAHFFIFPSEPTLKFALLTTLPSKVLG